ncbi:FAD-dependent monooxygenase [Kocuria sp. LHG3120]|uniref:FAD-dependent monooxygenase n=1 Tax=Kocuria sp. LHG3120 TaxID=2804590 RepID=UPI003CFABAFB
MSHTNSTSLENAFVVGGGIGGLATALGLVKAGYSATVVEQAPAFGEVGAGLQLGPNATRILDSWGLMDQVKAVGCLPENLVMRDAITGEELTRLPLTGEFVQRYGAPYVVIHRTDLHSILLEACREAGVTLQTDVRIGAVERTETGTRAVAEDGQAFEADLTIGADGLHSVLRQGIVGDQPVPSGYVAYRGTVPSEDVPTDQGLNDVVVWVGPACHVVQYRLRAGAVLNVVAVFESPSFLRGEEEFGGVEELEAAFAACHPRVRETLEHIGRHQRWAMFDREPAEHWGEDRIVLTGDAAHPMLQYLAQGCCQALEDAKTLETLARQARDTGSTPWSEVTRRYTEARIPRTAQVQQRARMFGEICHATGTARLLRNELLAQGDVDLFEYTDWIYQDRIPALPTEPATPVSATLA